MKQWTVTVLALTACAAPDTPPPDPTDAVRVMLAASADAWNRGDLDAFLTDYAADSMTSFVAGGQVHYGIDWIREHYAPAFEPNATRDSLRFETLAARALDENHALATARYVLFRGDSVISSGPFTLVLRRIDGNWKIIHDQTSRDAN